LPVAEDYLLLGLRLGKHVDGLVDAYYGPQDLKDAVDEEPLVHASELADDGARLHAELADGWLRDQVHGLWTYARVLAGEKLSYSDEVERCYGVRPQRTPESVYEEVHAKLDELLPGDGSLYERRVAWRDRHRVSGDAALAGMRALLPLFRRRTAELFGLPDGEDVTLEPVTGEPWWAFNYYLGGLQSRVVLNTDTPTTTLDLLGLVAHEVYPGHHTEAALKEQHLIRERGLVEEAAKLVPTPQSILAEGIAETGLDLVFDPGGSDEALAVLRDQGLPLDDPVLAWEIRETIEGLGTLGLDAALMIHEEGVGFDEAVQWYVRWAMRPLDEARHALAFVVDPTWRAYVISYTAGRELCRRYVGGDPARFRTLLTEQVTVTELLSA